MYSSVKRVLTLGDVPHAATNGLSRNQGSSRLLQAGSSVQSHFHNVDFCLSTDNKTTSLGWVSVLPVDRGFFDFRPRTGWVSCSLEHSSVSLLVGSGCCGRFRVQCIEPSGLSSVRKWWASLSPSSAVSISAPKSSIRDLATVTVVFSWSNLKWLESLTFRIRTGFKSEVRQLLKSCVDSYHVLVIWTVHCLETKENHCMSKFVRHWYTQRIWYRAGSLVCNFNTQTMSGCVVLTV